MKSLTTYFLIIISITSYSQTITDKVITLDPYLSFQNYEHFQRLTLSSPDSPIEYLDGFEFSWGYKYELSIRETELRETLSDGTQFLYSLDIITTYLL